MTTIHRDPCASPQARQIEAALLASLPADAVDYGPAADVVDQAPPAVVDDPDLVIADVVLADRAAELLDTARAYTPTAELPDAAVDIDGMTAVGLTRRQVDHWTGAGYLRPVDRPRARKGAVRHWPAGERTVAARMARLTAAGLTARAAHDIARAGGYATIAGVRIAILDDELPHQGAYRRAVLRAPARAALALRLRALLAAARAATDRLQQANPGADITGATVADLLDADKIMNIVDDIQRRREIKLGPDHRTETPTSQ